MLRRLTLILSLMIAFAAVPASAQQNLIVRANPGVGLNGLQNICLPLLCQVVRGLDGSNNQLFLVHPSILSDLFSLIDTLLGQRGVSAVEPDQILSIPQVTQSSIPNDLWNNIAMQYYGTATWQGFVQQPAMQIIRAQSAQSAFHLTGAGVVALIDTGVDTNHPVLMPVLVPGYDFTRNTSGGSELPDLSSCSNTSSSTTKSFSLLGLLSLSASASSTSTCPTETNSNGQPAYVQQSTVAVLDQSTVAVLEGDGMSDFGHGTMVAGIVHLVAPTAKIMPLKAFQSNGTGNLSDIIRAIYYATQNHVNVINMSFDISSYSPELARAISSADQAGIICVAAAGNDGKDELVFPAALLGQVMGIASTSDLDTQSSFSNYGADLVWMAAPGENIISTYPYGTYAAESGTSFSAPFVSGAAALIVQASNGKCGQVCAAQVLAHAKWISGNLGNGRLDVYQALSSMFPGRGGN
jgi:subtilisin family serine protease